MNDSHAAIAIADDADTAPVSALRVFGALLHRDVRVARRELPFFLLRTVLQPVLFVVVFGYLIPRMGYISRGYAAAMLPGMLAVALTLASIQAVALPLVQDFGWSKEIEDRLLAPTPTWVVALEKVVAGGLQGVISALVVLPISLLIMGDVPGLTLSRFGLLLAVTALGSLAFSALGLWFGTAVPPQQISMMFVVFTPMIFFGCAYFPWKGLAHVPALQIAVLVNPLTFVAEGMRGALTPGVPHMPLPAAAGALLLIGGAFGVLGLRSFSRRAIA